MSESNDKPVYGDVPFRIRVGVVGRHDLSDPASIVAQLDHVLDTKIYPCSLRERWFGARAEPGRIVDLFDCRSRRAIARARHTPIVFGVVTTLAEGAERLVAEKVLQVPGSRIQVVLPYAPADYIEELDTPASREEFERLYRSARHPVALHGSRADRERARVIAGRHVVNRCDVLIAVCDASAADRNSPEVSATVAYAKQKQRPVITIAAQPPHDITCTRGHGLNAESLGGIERLNALLIEPATLNEYVDNVYTQTFSGPKASEARASRAVADSEVPDHAREVIRKHLIPFYARASSVAKKNQQAYLRAGLWVYILAPLAVAAVVLATLFEPFNWVGFSIEFVLLLTILAIVVGTDRGRARKKWIETRFLAERLRSGMFLAACGVEAAHTRVSPYRVGLRRSDEWMERAFQEIWGRMPRLGPCWGGTCDGFIAFIQRNWIADQITYHQGKAKDAGRRSRWLERGGVAIFVLALVAAACHLALTWGVHGPHDSLAHKALTFLAVVLPAVGASCGGIRTHREYSRLEKRSEAMVDELTDLQESFAEVSTTEDFEIRLTETEELMLHETQDWLMLMGTMKLEAA